MRIACQPVLDDNEFKEVIPQSAMQYMMGGLLQCLQSNCCEIYIISPQCMHLLAGLKSIRTSNKEQKHMGF